MRLWPRSAGANVVARHHWQILAGDQPRLGSALRNRILGGGACRNDRAALVDDGASQRRRGLGSFGCPPPQKTFRKGRGMTGALSPAIGAGMPAPIVSTRSLPDLRLPGATAPQTLGCGSSGDVAAPAFSGNSDVAASLTDPVVRGLTGGGRLSQRRTLHLFRVHS